MPGEGASKTQIVYACNLNFHIVVTYLELIKRNGLAKRTKVGLSRYKATAKRLEIHRHLGS